MDLVELLAEIDRLKGEIDALRPIDAVLERKIMQKFRLDWNYHSNAIEGNSLSLGETRAFLLHGLTASGKPFKDYLDIKGHNESIQYLEGMVRNRPPMTEVMIRELHKILLVEPYEVRAKTADGLPTSRTIEIGQYKTTPNHVETKTGEIFYFAEPAAVPARMHELVSWLRQTEAAGEIHPLIIAATLHYEFVRIHPFDDGNGRMARLLMNLVLMRAGFPPVVIRLEDKEGEYFPALTEADADGNLEPLTLFIGKELLRSEEMFLSGAKGEDIATNGDFEKKIALLQQRIDSVNQREKAKPIDFFEKYITDFVSGIIDSSSRVSHLFDHSKFLLWDNLEKGDGALVETIDKFMMIIGKNDYEYFQKFGPLLDFELQCNKFSLGKASLVVSFKLEFQPSQIEIEINGGMYQSQFAPRRHPRRMIRLLGEFQINESLNSTDDDVLQFLQKVSLNYEDNLVQMLDVLISKSEFGDDVKEAGDGEQSSIKNLKS